MRLRHVAAINPATPEFDLLDEAADVTFLPLEAVWPRKLDTSRTRPKGEVASGYTRFREGDVLVPKITPTFEADRSTIATGLLGGVGAGTTELHVIRPGRIDARYLNYLVSTAPFLQGGQAEMTGVAGQRRVPDGWLRNFHVPLLERAQQGEVADFLDAETARIDALIEKKRRLIEVLHLRAGETVARLVLRGVLKHELARSRSGLFDLVPIAWGETQLRHLGFTVQTGPFGSQLHASEYIENGWPVINPANLLDGKIRADPRVSITDEKRSELQIHVLKAGDLVMGRRGEMGRVALVTEAEEGWICGTGCLRITARQARLDPRYLLLLLRTPALRAHLSLSSVGSTMENLNAEIVLSAPTLIPSNPEQRQIVELARRASDASRDVIARIESQLTPLSEHRQALITAAVTGQLDVSKAAA